MLTDVAPDSELAQDHLLLQHRLGDEVLVQRDAHGETEACLAIHQPALDGLLVADPDLAGDTGHLAGELGDQARHPIGTDGGGPGHHEPSGP